MIILPCMIHFLKTSRIAFKAIYFLCLLALEKPALPSCPRLSGRLEICIDWVAGGYIGVSLADVDWTTVLEAKALRIVL